MQAEKGRQPPYFCVCPFRSHTVTNYTAPTRFLAKHTQPAQKVEGTKEWVRTTGIKDPEVEAYEAQFSGENRN